MGVCCTSNNKIEDSIYKNFEKMKIWSLSIKQVETIFKDLSPSHLEQRKNSFSSKALALFDDTLKLISKENWIKLCESNFIDQSDTKQNINSQINLFKILYEISGQFFKIGNKIGLLINLIPYLVKENNSLKSSKFFELIETENLRYAQFKSNFTNFIKIALICQILALKENYVNSSTGIEKEKENSSLTKEELDEYLDTNFKDELIVKFVDSIFEEFERLKLSSTNIRGDELVFSKVDFEFVFKMREKIFDLNDLRADFIT